MAHDRALPQHLVSLGLATLVLLGALVAAGSPTPPETSSEPVVATALPAAPSGLAWVHAKIDVDAGVTAIPLNLTERVWIHGWHTEATLDWRGRLVDQFALFQGIQFGGPGALGWTAFWGHQDLAVKGIAGNDRIDASIRTSATGLWDLSSTTGVLFPLPAGEHHFLFAAPEAAGMTVDVWLLAEDAAAVTLDDEALVTSDAARVFDASDMEGPSTTQPALAARVALAGDAQVGRLISTTTQGTGRHLADWHVEPGVGTYSIRTVGADHDISESRTEVAPFADRFDERVDGAAATATAPFTVELRQGAHATTYDHGFRFITFAIDIP